MDLNPALPPEIEQALARGWVVLTANQRAARSLRHAFDLRQPALGHSVWEPPEILAWDTWLVSLWNRLLLEGNASDLLLSPAQEHTIWRAVIAADTTLASLRPADALAETAATAWTLLHDHRARQLLQSSLSNTDTRAFARWVAEFEHRCARAQYLTQAQLPETIRSAIAHHHLSLWPGYLLVGFDSRTPAQSALLDAIRATGTPVEEHEPSSFAAARPAGAPFIAALSRWVGDDSQPTSSDQRFLTSTPDDHSELAACARWLRARLTQQPHARIAVIVPSLEAARAEIDRVFRQHLAPELNDITAPTTSAPYEFSLGVPLSRTPLAAAALDILRWIAAPLPLDRVSALLLSPHFAEPSATEHLARAEFDAFVLRRQHLLHPAISIAGLRNLVSNPKHAASLPTLLTHLRLLANRKESTDRTHAAWATAFHDLLQAAGWAPLAHLDSVEFQARRKWDEALDQLATLDFDSRADGTRISFTDALAALERITAETLFAPESRHAPIQIMGPLESAGSTFDAIWFLRANDLSWPVPSSPNPLLPWLLQRELAMPGADPSADTARARRTTQRIAASAPTVVFSYAKQSADAHQRPSPILTGLALESRNPADLAPALPEPAPIELDTFPDTTPIPFPPDQVHPGGVGVLQLQAACGFRAFAEKRLFSTALDSIELGLDARERGNLVHLVLERFWAAVESQSALKQMSTADRNTLLARNIDDALAEHYAHPAPGWPTAYLHAEHQRLLNLLGPWLDYEANQRTPFTVHSREAELTDVPIGPLRLNVRVDRVDLVLLPETEGDEPGEIILDYKTGSAHPTEWLGPRPDAPQLPLYAVVANPQNLAAVAFASVRLGKDMELTGYQAHDHILPKPARLKADSLDAQVREWSDILTSLAEDFHAGNASVSPKHYPQTCQYCEQRLLCRLNPSSLDPDVLEEIDEESDTLEESDFA